MGVSIGVERVFSILEAQAKAAKMKPRTTQTDVYVISAQKNLSEERMKICTELWNGDIRVCRQGFPCFGAFHAVFNDLSVPCCPLFIKLLQLSGLETDVNNSQEILKIG